MTLSGNIYCAQVVANRFQQFFHQMNRTEHLGDIRTTTVQPNVNTQLQLQHPNNDDDVEIHEVNVPQQTNGYDCGIHVLLNAETILHDFHQSLCCAAIESNTTMITKPYVPPQCFREDQYFRHQQQSRLSNRNFSIIERRKIAQDMIEQSLIYGGGSGN
jgi:hypothetical protein